MYNTESVSVSVSDSEGIMSSLSLQDLRIVYLCEDGMIVRIDLDAVPEHERTAAASTGGISPSPGSGLYYPPGSPLRHLIAHHETASACAGALVDQMDAYFGGELQEFTLDVKFPDGTQFEQAVWRTLRDVPYGAARSYRWLAERIGRPRASRAVGQALGKNPLPIVLPCHRVIASDGSLGGYSCGVAIKELLLRLESEGPAHSLLRHLM